MTVVAALNLILPSLVCVDVPKQMFLHLIVAEDSLVALLVLLDKSCWRDLTNKIQADSVDFNVPFSLIKVLKVQVYILTREILIPHTAFLNTSLKGGGKDKQIIRLRS